MSFFSELPDRQLQSVLSRLIEASRDARATMNRFSLLGQLSHQLSAAYPDLRKLSSVIRALDQACRDARTENLARRRQMTNIRRSGRTSVTRSARQRARHDAYRELSLATKHLANAVKALESADTPPGTKVQLKETLSFMRLSRSELRKR